MTMPDAYKDIAVESRVRLSRNLASYPFPARLGTGAAADISASGG